MNFLKLAQKNRERDPDSFEELYRNLTQREIRKHAAPSVCEENAVLRKTLFNVIDTMIGLGILSKDEARERFHDFFALHDAIEKCKESARAELGMEGKK